MSKIIIDSADLVSVANEIDHNCLMLNLSCDDSASDDIDYYVPRIKSAANALRTLVNKSEPVKEKEHE